MKVYDKSAYGVGYIGEGAYKISFKRVFYPHYIYWRTMMKRCYSDHFHTQFPTYKDCSVVKDWHNFQNFAKWYDENYYEIGEEMMHLDKDILVKGNKVYSPETCVFVPQSIN